MDLVNSPNEYKVKLAAVRLRVNDTFVLILSAFVLLYVATELKLKLIYGSFLILPFLSLCRLKTSEYSRVNIEADKLVVLLGFAAAMCLSGVLNSTSLFAETFARDTIIILGGFLVFLKTMPIYDKHVKLMFVCFSVGALIWGENYKDIGEIMSSFSLIDILLPGNAVGEFHMGAVYGPFLLFFYKRRQWDWFGLALFMALMSGKRIVIVCAVGAIIADLIFNVIVRKYWRTVILVLGGVMATIAVSLTNIADFLVAYFDLPMAPSRLIMGRNSSIDYMLNGIVSAPLFQQVFGHGPGMADYQLGSIVMWSNGVTANPHNDYLKLLYDVGAFGFLMYFAMFFCFFGSRRNFSILIYSLLAYIADNTLIFLVYIMVLGMVSAAIDEDERKQSRQLIQGANLLISDAEDGL